MIKDNIDDREMVFWIVMYISIINISGWISISDCQFYLLFVDK